MAPTAAPASLSALGGEDWKDRTEEIIRDWEDGSMSYDVLLDDSTHSKTLRLIYAYAIKDHSMRPPSINLIESVAGTLVHPKKSYRTPDEVHHWRNERGLEEPAKVQIAETDKEIQKALTTFQPSPVEPSSLKTSPLKNVITAELSYDDFWEENEAEEYNEQDSTSNSEEEEEKNDNQSEAEVEGEGKKKAPKEPDSSAKTVIVLLSGKLKKNLEPDSGKAGSMFNGTGTQEAKRAQAQRQAARAAAEAAQAAIPNDSFVEAWRGENADSEFISNRTQKAAINSLSVSGSAVPAALRDASAFITPTKPINAARTIFDHTYTPASSAKSGSSVKSTSSKDTPTKQRGSGIKRTRASPPSDTPTTKKTKVRKAEVTTGYKGTADPGSSRVRPRYSAAAVATVKPMLEAKTVPEEPKDSKKKGTGSSTPSKERPDDKKGKAASKVQLATAGDKNGRDSAMQSDMALSIAPNVVLPMHGDNEKRKSSAPIYPVEVTTRKSDPVPKGTKVTTKNPAPAATVLPAVSRKEAFVPRVVSASTTSSKPQTSNKTLPKQPSLAASAASHLPKSQTSNKTLQNPPPSAVSATTQPFKPVSLPAKFAQVSQTPQALVPFQAVVPSPTLPANPLAPSFAPLQIPAISKPTQKAVPKFRNPFDDTDSPTSPRQQSQQIVQPKKSSPPNPFVGPRGDRRVSNLGAVDIIPAPRERVQDSTFQKPANPAFGSRRPSPPTMQRSQSMSRPASRPLDPPPFNPSERSGLSVNAPFGSRRPSTPTAQRSQSTYRPGPPIPLNPTATPIARSGFGVNVPSGPRNYIPTGPRRQYEPRPRFPPDVYRPGQPARNPADRYNSDHYSQGSRSQPSQHHASVHDRAPPGSIEPAREYHTTRTSTEIHPSDHQDQDGRGGCVRKDGSG